ncbi:RBL10 [Scenedesmus sp. PABB004]|nr:RBL10 [Scenedesmus sp. PABB004]
MQHSLGPRGGLAGSLHARAARSLRRLRRGGLPHGLAARSLAGSLAAGGSVACLASAAPGGSGNSSSGPRPSARDLAFGSELRRVTDSLLVLHGLVYVLDWASKGTLMLLGAKVNALVAAGQWWRLLSCNFLHIGLIHLAVNSATLANIGPHAELLAGSRRFSAVYLAGGLAGAAASFLLTPGPSMGASGALFGLGAALGVFYWRHRDIFGRRSESVLQQLGVCLAINVAFAATQKGIDGWGHIGGLLGGAVASWLLGPNMVREGGRFVDRPPLPLLAFKGNERRGGEGGLGLKPLPS